ncbi:importin-5-like, partial [Trifolium medium]|nr:importin-5-like [Trifolium medium]
MSDMVLDALQIAENSGVSDETRRLAFELVMAMTELKEWRKVVDVCYELLMKHYLDSADWKMRHAGITLLSLIAKEFSDEM